MVRGIRSDSEQRFSTKGNTISQKRTVGSRVGDKIGSGLFDRSRSGDRDGLSSDTRDDAVLYDTGCGYDKVDCICQVTNPEVRHFSGKDNAVADMLSRARFGDDITKSDNEEVSEDYFASEHIC